MTPVFGQKVYYLYVDGEPGSIDYEIGRVLNIGEANGRPVVAIARLDGKLVVFRPPSLVFPHGSRSDWDAVEFEVKKWKPFELRRLLEDYE